MNERLIQQQLQESPRTTEFDNVAGVAAVLFCSCAATVQTSVPTQLWTLFAGLCAAATAALVLAHSARALTVQCLDEIMEASNTNKDNKAFNNTDQTALMQGADQNLGYASIATGSPDLLIFRQAANKHAGCFAALMLTITFLLVITLGDRHYQFAESVSISDEITAGLIAAGVVLICLLLNQLRQPMRRVYFDRTKGVFWVEQVLLFGIRIRESAQMPIYQVIALQQISHEHRQPQVPEAWFSASQKSNAHELNVVFRNGNRINIICHTDCYSLKKDTLALSNFIQVPVWLPKATESAPTE